MQRSLSNQSLSSLSSDDVCDEWTNGACSLSEGVDEPMLDPKLDQPDDAAGPITPPGEDRPATEKSTGSLSNEADHVNSDASTVSMHEPDNESAFMSSSRHHPSLVTGQGNIFTYSTDSEPSRETDREDSSAASNVLIVKTQPDGPEASATGTKTQLQAANNVAAGRHQSVAESERSASEFQAVYEDGVHTSKAPSAAFEESLELKLILEKQAGEWVNREVARQAREKELLHLTFHFARRTIAAGEMSPQSTA